MLFFVSTLQPAIFRDKLPFANSSKYDTPIYDRSIAVFDIPVSEERVANLKDAKMYGFLPFVNTKVSNKSPHPILRGKSFHPGVYVGFKRKFKVEELWAHDALFLNREQLLFDQRVKYNNGHFVFSTKDEKFFVNPGNYRALSCDFVNPVNKGKYFSGINMHRGPGKKGNPWNYSLGCVTVEPESFDKVLTGVQYQEVVGYIHCIDDLILDPSKIAQSKIFVPDQIKDIRNWIYGIEFKEDK